MSWPFVSRGRYEDALKQIEELKASNAKLLDLALNKTQAAPEKEEEPEPSKPIRRLGRDIRVMATKAMRDKAIQSKGSLTPTAVKGLDTWREAQ